MDDIETLTAKFAKLIPLAHCWALPSLLGITDMVYVKYANGDGEYLTRSEVEAKIRWIEAGPASR